MPVVPIYSRSCACAIYGSAFVPICSKACACVVEGSSFVPICSRDRACLVEMSAFIPICSKSCACLVKGSAFVRVLGIASSNALSGVKKSRKPFGPASHDRVLRHAFDRRSQRIPDRAAKQTSNALIRQVDNPGLCSHFEREEGRGWLG